MLILLPGKKLLQCSFLQRVRLSEPALRVKNPNSEGEKLVSASKPVSSEAPVIKIDGACARLVQAPRSPQQVRHNDVKINLGKQLLLLLPPATRSSSVRAHKVLLLLL
jgi:hypothetical protein